MLAVIVTTFAWRFKCETGGEAAAVLQRNAIAIANVERIIATVQYQFVIAVWRAKEAE